MCVGRQDSSSCPKENFCGLRIHLIFLVSRQFSSAGMERVQRPADGVAQQRMVNEGMPEGAAVTEQLVVVPRGRRCPMFNGMTGISITEWIEETQSCIQAHHLSAAEQAFFLFDHLEGSAEIKYHTTAERNDPAKILTILRELYGWFESYITLQHAFFSRKQQEGEMLLQFSFA